MLVISCIGMEEHIVIKEHIGIMSHVGNQLHIAIGIMGLIG